MIFSQRWLNGIELPQSTMELGSAIVHCVWLLTEKKMSLAHEFLKIASWMQKDNILKPSGEITIMQYLKRFEFL